MPLLYVSTAWLAGIVAGSMLTIPAWLLALPLPVIPLFFLMPNHRRSLAVLAMCLLALPGGALVYQSSQQPLNDTQVQYYNEKGKVLLTGIIDDEPEVRGASIEFKFAASSIRISDNTSPVKGGVLVRLPFYRSFQYGDMLQLSGKLETPLQFEDFDYRSYLENKGIYSVMNYPAASVTGTDKGFPPLSWIYGLRSSLSNSLSVCLPEPQSSLARAILLGLRGSLPFDLVQSFYMTGTTHLIAISGMNLTILLGMVLALAIWLFGRKNKAYFWISLAFIWLYTVLTGMPATMVRAAIMGSVFLAAELLGRQRNGLAALVLAAALMTAVEPRVLWDTSFQLSFLSMLGLVLIAPYFIEFTSPHGPPGQSRYIVVAERNHRHQLRNDAGRGNSHLAADRTQFSFIFNRQRARHLLRHAVVPGHNRHFSTHRRGRPGLAASGDAVWMGRLAVFILFFTRGAGIQFRARGLHTRHRITAVAGYCLLCRAGYGARVY